MPHMTSEPDDQPTTIDAAMGALRVIAGAIGMLMILVGLGYAIRLLNGAFRFLQSPDGAAGAISKWQEALGAHEFDFVIREQTYPGSKILAIVILAAGALFVTWLIMSVIQTGAKMVTWIASDKDVAKRLLARAFGVTVVPPSERSTAPPSPADELGAKPWFKPSPTSPRFVGAVDQPDPAGSRSANSSGTSATRRLS